MSLRKLGADSAYIMVAVTALAVLQWVIMAVAARIEGPRALGEYALAQAFATPASYLAWFSIRQQYLVSRESDGTGADYMFLRIVAPALVFGALLAFIGTVYSSTTLFWISAGIFAMKYAEGFFDFVYGRLQQVGEARTVATTSLTRCLISLIVFAAVYWVTRSLAPALFAITAVWLALFILQRRQLWAFVDLREVFAFSNLRTRASLAMRLMPLGVSAVIMSLITVAPRFLVEHQFGPAELGFFAAAIHFLTVGSIAVGSVGQSLMPGLSRAVVSGRTASFWKQLGLSVVAIQAMCLAGAGIAVLIGSDVLRIVYGPAFAQSGKLLVWAALAAGPVYCASLVTNAFYAAQLRTGLLALQLVSLAVIVIATLVLTPALGMAGAFAAMLIAGLTQCVLGALVLAHFWKRQRAAQPPDVPALDPQSIA
jgi:O-antigen/teichoic acid export membrane protein